MAKIIIEYNKDQDAYDDIDDVRQAVARRNPLDSPNVTLQKGDDHYAAKEPSNYFFDEGEFSAFNVDGHGAIFVVERSWFVSGIHPLVKIDDVIIVHSGEYRGYWLALGIDEVGGNKSIAIVVRRLPILMGDCIK